MAGAPELFARLSPPVRRMLLGNGISSVGTGLTFSFLVIYLGQVRGFGTLVAGGIVAYMALLGLACTVLVGTLVDRFGPRPVLIGGLTVTAMGVASLAFVTTIAQAIAATTILSVGSAGFWSPQAALYARLTPPAQRQDVFGLQFMVLNLGLGIGGLVAATIVDVARPGTFTVLYLLDAVTFLVYIAILLTMRGATLGAAEPGDEVREPGGYREVLRDRALIGLAIGALVLLTFGYGSLEVGLPTYTTVIAGLPASAVAAAYAVNTAVIVVLQIFVLRIIRGRSRTGLGLLVGVLWGASWVVVGLAVLFPPLIAAGVICLGVAVFGVGECVWSPVAHTIVNELAPDHMRGRYNAVISWTWNASGALGPAIAAVLLGAGLSVWWVALVGCGCVAGGLLIRRVRRFLTAEQDGVRAEMSA